MKRLQIHDKVLISIPNQAFGLEAVVLVFSEHGMTLEALDKVAVARLPEAMSGSLISFRYRGTLVALAGTLFCVKPVGDLRFQLADSELHLERGSRFKFEMPITVRLADSEAEVDAKTVDVGPDGLLVECDLEVNLGDSVTVAINSAHVDEVAASTAEVVTGKAEVVRGPASGLMALRLPPESSAVRNALGELVVAFSRRGLTRPASAAGSGVQRPDF